jgi:uncharacterized protein YehS (DUF1456 family)
MTRNDLLRRLRYAFDLPEPKVIALVRAGGAEVPDGALAGWLAREDEPGFVPVPDAVLGAFLDGLVLERRGPRDPGAPAPERGPLDNNAILKKLRVALEWKESDMLAALAAAGATVSPSELGALFRKPGHKHYRACGDQFLRQFVSGMTTRLRGAT